MFFYKVKHILQLSVISSHLIRGNILENVCTETS